MTSTVVRALPGLATPTPGGQIPVRQVVDESAQDYDVRLDLADQIDLAAFAWAVHSDPAAMAEFTVMMRNPIGARSVLAAAELRRMPAIRAALTVTLSPAEAGLAADSLSERLAQAALEPARCEHWDGVCNRFTDGDEDYCAEHLADVQEHGLPDDRGSYDWSDA